jgi:ATP-binding cassette subfamily C protein LapB
VSTQLISEKEKSHFFPQQIKWLSTYLMRDVKNITIAKEDVYLAMQSVREINDNDNLIKQVTLLLQLTQYETAVWTNAPELAELPMVAVHESFGLMIVYGKNTEGAWLVQTMSGRGQVSSWLKGTSFTRVHAFLKMREVGSARAEFLKILKQEPRWIVFVILASFVGAGLALLTSLYSMQVYDRVIGSHSLQTLEVLTIGVVIAYLIDLPTKMARSAIIDKASASIDKKCANAVFSRLLAVRLDQFSGSVGTLAAQVKGYESIRSFAIALILFLTTDAPFALLFLLVVFLIGGPIISLVPVIFLIVSIFIGLVSKKQIVSSAHGITVSGNKRQGLLVEAIEGAETLKATGARWRVMGKWNALSAQSVAEYTVIKHMSDRASYLAAFNQQLSYIFLIATGAYLTISSTTLSTGGLVACTILSGRVLTPMSMIPGLLVQWAHAKTALESLDSMFRLETDNAHSKTPLSPETLRGEIKITDVVCQYPGQIQPIKVNDISIFPGEKVAILGAIGSGKSTLLRAIAGLTKPSEGQVLLDGMNVLQIAPECRAEKIGFLPQSITLFSGTLRDNLNAGLPHISETQILETSTATGLSQLINSRDEGIDLPIMEGSAGLSGGQRQLVGITRLLIQSPDLWLLDEPTSAMDEGTEQRCIKVLQKAVQPKQTFIIVTHKPSLLVLVDRIIVMTPSGVVLDGPKEEVLEKITSRS